MWPSVKLGKVISHRKEFITIDDTQEYKRCRVQLHAKGIVLRDLVTGALIKTKQQQVCRGGEFLVAEIDAKVGGFGIVPDELDGAIVSSHYFLFTINNQKLDTDFLGYYAKTPFFRDQVNAQGSTNYAAIRPNHVLDYEIPLPPISEQRRIVAKIERLAKKVDMANSLRSQSVAETDALFQSAMHAIWSNQAGWNKAKIGNVASTVSGQVDPTCEPYASMPHINGESMESSTGRLLNNYRLAKDDGVKSGKYHFKAGAVLYSKIRPYLRKSVIVPFEGICSADVYAIDEIDSRIDPGFFKYTLISQDFTGYANKKSGRTRMPKLNQKQLFDYEMAFPSIEEQSEIVIYLDGLQAKVNRLGAGHSQTQKELDALLPSILDKAFNGGL